MARRDESPPSTIHRNDSRILTSIVQMPSHQSPTKSSQGCIETSPTTQLVQSPRAVSTPPERPAPKSRNRSWSRIDFPSTARAEAKWSRAALSRKRSQYYEEAFACRESSTTAKARAVKTSLITAEVKRNFSLDSDQEFLTDLTFLLSGIYHRPPGCIVLLNTHCLILLESSAEPAYQISITASPIEVATTKNKRTVGLVQSFIQETTSVPGNRGAFLFHSLQEGNMIAGTSDIQPPSQKHADSGVDSHDLPRDVTHSRMGRCMKSSIVQPEICSNGIHAACRTTNSDCGVKFIEYGAEDAMRRATETKRVRKRKSLMGFLGF